MYDVRVREVGTGSTDAWIADLERRCGQVCSLSARVRESADDLGDHERPDDRPAVGPWRQMAQHCRNPRRARTCAVDA